MVVAGEGAGIGGAGIADGSGRVGGDDVDVEIDEAFAGDSGIAGTHAMRGMARGTREAIVDVAGMLGESGIGNNLIEVMALRAEGVGTVHGEVGAGKEVGDEQAGGGSLAELVTALENVRPLRAVRTIRTKAAKFAIVIAVVTIAASDARAHGAPQRDAIELEHLSAQAGLRERAGAIVSDGMAG